MIKTQYKHSLYSKNRVRLLFSFMLITCLTFHATWAQKDLEIGLPYIQNYSSSDYDAFDQNWSITQDSLGIMYFANGDGVLSYNGVEWDLIELPNKSSVFALATSTDGSIYVGAIGELGYLEANSIGLLSYISLLSKLPEMYHDFSEIRVICSTKDGIYFNSKKYLFKWDGTKFDVIENSGDTSMFYVNDILFKRVKDSGLMTLKNNTFERLPLGDMFANEKIYAILPYQKSEFLIATRDQLYTYNGTTITALNTNASSFYQDNIIYNGILLNDGSFAFGSLKKGILILDSKGTKKLVLSQKGLLNSNSSLALYQDQSGILWAGLQSGISKIEYPSPFTYFNTYNHTPNMVFDLERFNEKLYVGGPEGLFYLKNELGANHFEQTKENFGMVWDMVLFQDKLLVGSNLAVFEINVKEETKKLFDLTVSSLYRSKLNPNRIFIATDTGLSTMLHKNNHWTLEHTFEEIDFFINTVVETLEGDLWLGTDKNEVVGITFSNHDEAINLIKPTVKIFKPQDGLPDKIGKPYLIKDQFYLSAGDQVYKFDTKNQKFVNDKELFIKFGLEKQKAKINYVDENNQVGLITYNGETRLNQMLATPKKNDSYTLNSLEEQRIINMKKFGALNEFIDSILWYKGKQGVIRHDLKTKPANNTIRSKAFISKVFTQNDSLLFAGYTSSQIPKLAFKNNQLRFQYSNPSFHDETKNQFQYILKGFEADWSSWSFETKKDYTNIPAGNYTFKVRSKNIYNTISESDSFSFFILTPWYSSWWAYLLYSVCAVSAIALIVQWRSKGLQRKNETLEGIVQSRTMEIQHKNELLNHQTEKLVQLNEAKTQLYANITHEFRTPLTVILGMADTLDKELEASKKPLEMIKRNGKKLLRLINEMLDLAKLESGNMTLQLVQTDIIPFVKYLSESFHSLAEERKINLVVYSEIDTLEMDFDVNKMASIISNLLSNAIKFTQEHGKIVVHLNKNRELKNEYFVIKIKDTGLGVSEDDKEHLFDRFYQVDDSSTKEKSGSGIGLALVKEFVDLMNGTIEVKSTLTKGSTFIVRIPKTNTAIKTADTRIRVDHPAVQIAAKTSGTESPVLIDDSQLPLLLIIEDNEDVAYYLKTCLLDTYRALHAVNGDMGINMALEYIPDIIISDVMMPGKDGFEVCKALKTNELTDHIPIIMLTAKATVNDRLTGLSHGADAYLAKPFVKEELFTRLDQLVSLRKKMLQKFENNGFSKLLKKKVESPETKFLQKTIKIIHEHIEDSNFGASQLAYNLHLSESQIYRKLKAITDKSTAVFIRSIRLQKGKELILTTDKNISEVAYEVGFNDPSWFSKAFKEEFGVAPSDV